MKAESLPRKSYVYFNYVLNPRGVPIPTDGAYFYSVDFPDDPGEGYILYQWHGDFYEIAVTDSVRRMMERSEGR